ncbi:MAG: tetratricopeptide repeat protein [bacterium]|nr:tetratricopeptide repeat protein [bacterium]
MYDLADDPDEQNDLYKKQLERASELHEKLAGHFGEELDSSAAPMPSKQLDADEMLRLRSLGYTVSSPKGAPDAGKGADPRSMMQVMDEVNRVVFGKPPEQRGPEEITKLEDLLQQNPDFVPGFRYLGVMRRANGDLEGAVAAFAHGVKLHPNSPDLRMMLAECRGQLGQNQQALDDLHILLAADPENAIAHMLCGRLLLVSDKPDSAITSLLVATTLEPDLRGCAEALRQAHARAGRSAELLPFLDSMLESHPKSSALRKAKSVLLYGQGQVEEAEVVLRDGLRLAHEDPQAVNNLVKLLLNSIDPERKRLAEAAALMAELSEKKMKSDADLMLTLSQVLGAQGKVDEAMTACKQALEIAEGNQHNSVVKMGNQYLRMLENARPQAGSR